MNRKIIYALLFFIILTCIMTFPLVLNFRTCIPGFFSSDESYVYLWDNWRISYSLHRNLPLKYTSFVAYPYGWQIGSLGGYITYLWDFWQYILSFLMTPVLNFNLQIFINFILSSLFAYLLAFHLTRDKIASILSGVIFGFCPYQFVRSWQHLGLTYNQWVPLALYSAILLKEKTVNKNLILFILSLLLLFSFDYSIAYLGSITLLAFFFYILFYNWRIKFFKEKYLFIEDLKYFKRVLFIGIITFVILSPQFFSVIRKIMFSPLSSSSVWNPHYRQFKDLFEQSAKLLSYTLPATVHPVFGRFTEGFIGSFLYGDSFTEHTLYLGWTPLILAFLAVKRWRKSRKSRIAGHEPRTTDFNIGFFITLAFVAWFFSQPPWWKIGPVKIYMPSFFMYKIMPMFRAYCRFGIVVMLAVAVLAGFGLKFLLERFKTRGTRALVSFLFYGLVLFEFWNYPPFKVIDVSRVPAVYYWLRQEPQETVIAEYPLDADSPNELYKFFQTAHEKKMINGTIPFTYANKVAKMITKLSSAQTAGILSWMKVRYVLVHHDGYAQTGLVEDREELKQIADNERLIFIRRFPQQDCPREDIPCVSKTGIIDVYEVNAEPVEPEVPKE